MPIDILIIFASFLVGSVAVYVFTGMADVIVGLFLLMVAVHLILKLL